MKYRNADILLFGSSHISTSDPAEIRKLIMSLKPGVISVELCHERLPKLLQIKGAASVENLKNLDDISDQTDQFRLFQHGADMLAPLQLASKTGTRYELIDRPQSVTSARLAATVPPGEVTKFWCLRPVKFVLSLAVSAAIVIPVVVAGSFVVFSRLLPRQVWLIPGAWYFPVAAMTFLEWVQAKLEGTEAQKIRAVINFIREIEMRREACLSKGEVQPSMEDTDVVLNNSVIVDERDTFMAYKLQQVAIASPSKLIFSIVGMGHLDGIEAKLSREIKQSDFDAVSVVPLMSDADKNLLKPVLRSRGFDLKALRLMLHMQQVGAG